jgi:integrase/recombinase XerC
MDDFIQHLRDTDKSPGTVAAYAKDLRSFANFLRHPLTPQDCTPTDIRSYRIFLASVKVAPATINRRMATIKAYATFNGIHLEIKLCELERPAPRWLDRKQQAALLRELERRDNGARTDPARRQSARDRAVVSVMLNCGLRISEAVALELGDVEMHDKSGELHVRHGKGDKPRTIPLNADVRRDLRAWLTWRPEVDTARLFVGKSGQALGVAGVTRMLGEYARRAKVTCTPHTLRHTFAKNLIDAGVGLERVAALMGHDSLESTKRYTLPSQQDLAAAVEKLEM